MTPEELGRRLRGAREQAGQTQDAVAAIVGLDATAIAKIERGKRGVGALELMSFARLYGVSLESLLDDRRAQREVHLRVAMRTGEALDGKIEAMQASLQHIVAADRWLHGVVQDIADSEWAPILTPVRQEAPSYTRGYQAADLFRQRHGLGNAPIADLAVVADELGVVVSQIPFGDHDAPDGCAAVDSGTRHAYVLINSDKPWARRRFTIAHEVAHLALGHLGEGEVAIDGSIGNSTPHETESNAFAAGLLMPESGVRGAVERLRHRLGRDATPLDWAVWLAASFGVSEEAAAYRLKNLGLEGVTGGDSVEAVKRAKERPELLRQVRMRLGLAPVTTDHERGVTEVGPAMRARISQALEKGVISVDDAALMLHTSPRDVYRWIVEAGIQIGATGEHD